MPPGDPNQQPTTAPEGPSQSFPFRQDYSPDDRDLLRRPADAPDEEPGRHRQDYSPDDRDLLRRPSDAPGEEPGRHRQDFSPDDRDRLRHPDRFVPPTGDVPRDVRDTDKEGDAPIVAPDSLPDEGEAPRRPDPPSDTTTPESRDEPIEIPDLPWEVPTGPTEQDSPTVPTDILEEPADTMHGDPEAELAWAQIQSENGYCVPVSVAMIVSEITGVPHGEKELVERAISMNLLYGEPGAWLGMTAEGTEMLIESFGIPASIELGSVETLRDYLDEGREIILMVDSDEVWYGDDDIDPNDVGMDHAVVITAIDDQSGIVYLNDPGHPEGKGYTLPVQSLDDAWADGGHAMVVTDEPAAAGRAQERPAAAGGFVLLPVVIASSALKRVDTAKPSDGPRDARREERRSGS